MRHKNYLYNEKLYVSHEKNSERKYLRNEENC